MAYKIQYSQEAAYRYPQEGNKQKVKIGKWICLLVILAAVSWMRVNGVPDFLIPGEPEVTKAAAAALINEIQDGIPVNRAITTFCETIIHEAGV